MVASNPSSSFSPRAQIYIGGSTSVRSYAIAKTTLVIYIINIISPINSSKLENLLESLISF